MNTISANDFIDTRDGKDTTLTQDSFGRIEDYARYKTGSSINIIGPTRADDLNGEPNISSAQTIRPGPGETYPQGYGPLNMTYRPVPAQGDAYDEGFPLVEDAAATYNFGANTAAGAIGLKITIGDTPLMVTHLGRFWTSGNTHTHQLAIYRAAEGSHDAAGVPSEMIAMVTIDANQTPDGDGYNYERLEQPVVLLPDETYYLASIENTFGTGPDLFPKKGTGAISFNPMFGSGLGLDTDHCYELTPTGQWLPTDQIFPTDPNVGFAPLVNIKIN